MKVKPLPKGLENAQSYQLILEILLFFLLAQIQGAIIVAGISVAAEGQYRGAGIVFPGGSFTGLGFPRFNDFADTRHVGDVGKAVCVIVMVSTDRGIQWHVPD